MRTRRWNELSVSQAHAARRFSDEVPGLTASQAAKHLDECFAVLEKARLRGITFREAWGNPEVRAEVDREN